MNRELYRRTAPHLQRIAYDSVDRTTNPVSSLLRGADDMNNLLLLQRSNEELKDYIKVAFCPELYGSKIRTSGINNFITKAFSLDKANNDLTQTSSANQPYLDKVAPTEKLSAKNPNGGSNYLTHPTVSFGANDEWTVETVLNEFGKNSGNFGTIGDNGNTTKIGLFAGVGSYNVQIYGNNINTTFDYNTARFAGKNTVLAITYKANVFNCYLNGINIGTANKNNTSFNFNTLFYSLYFNSIGTISSHHIFSKALTTTQVAERASILSSIFPEIPSVTIGTQTWAVRNYEAVATPQGNPIAEVQSAATWATSQTLYDNAYAAASGTVEQKTYAAVKAAAMWCHYNNDIALGAIYGKLYNWFAVKLLQMDIDYYNAANPTSNWGWRVPMQADFNTLATTLGGTSVAGGKMKMTGTTYWNTPNTGADNSSGFSGIGALVRTPTGGFGNGLNSLYIWHNDAFAELNNNKSSFSVYDSTDKKYGFSLRLIKTT